MPSLASYKRRAANHTERDEKHRLENLDLLFAPTSSFVGVEFSLCKMSVAVLSGSVLKDSWVESCEMVGVNFRGASIENVTFLGCSMTGAIFEGCLLRGVTFKNCILSGATFLGARLQTEVTFEDCQMDDADLRFYESEAGAPAFKGTHLRGVSLNINCEFWNGTFDEVAIADFGRLFARASQDEELIALAKRRWGPAAYDALDAYMRRPS